MRSATAWASARPRRVSDRSARPRKRSGLMPSTWPWRMRRILVTANPPLAPPAIVPGFFALANRRRPINLGFTTGWSPPVTAVEADDSYWALGVGRSSPRLSHRRQVRAGRRAPMAPARRCMRSEREMGDDGRLGIGGVVGRSRADREPAVDLASHRDGAVG